MKTSLLGISSARSSSSSFFTSASVIFLSAPFVSNKEVSSFSMDGLQTSMERRTSACDTMRVCKTSSPFSGPINSLTMVMESSTMPATFSSSSMASTISSSIKRWTLCFLAHASFSSSSKLGDLPSPSWFSSSSASAASSTSSMYMDALCLILLLSSIGFKASSTPIQSSNFGGSLKPCMTIFVSA